MRAGTSMFAGRGCLRGRCSGSPQVYVPIFIAFRFYEAGTFLSSPALAGSRFQQPGQFPLLAGQFLSYKCSIPPDRNKLSQFLQLFGQISFRKFYFIGVNFEVLNVSFFCLFYIISTKTIHFNKKVLHRGALRN